MTKKCFSCAVCGAIEPIVLPCGVQKRVYVTENEGLIIGVSLGCPSEDNDKPIYISDDFLTHAKKFRDEWAENAYRCAFQDYQDLWSSWNRENHLLTRHPRETLKEWLSSVPSKLYLLHEFSDQRGKVTHRAALHFVRLAEGFQRVSNTSLNLLPKHWYPQEVSL